MTEGILKGVCDKHRRVVVAENHSVIGGLGEAVAARIRAWLG